MAVTKSDFFLALNQVATERGISLDDVLESIKAALLAAYKKDYGPKTDDSDDEDEDDGLSVKINQETGEMHIMKDDEDITPPGFGRIAAQTARQVILQQIREAEKRTIVQHFEDQVGTMVKGRVIRFEGRNVLMDIGKAEGSLPPEEQIRNERFNVNDQAVVYITEIREDNFGNSRIILSRAHPALVEALFEKEVPEIESGTVKIHKVVREAGERSKIAVYSDQSGVDPVGACVGQKGMRVKAVTEELGGFEKIDIIQYHDDLKMFIREALSPAEVDSISINESEKQATISVSADQAPLAIGRNGVNVNLASRLTGYALDIEQVGGKPEESEESVDLPDDEIAVDEEISPEIETVEESSDDDIQDEKQEESES